MDQYETVKLEQTQSKSANGSLKSNKIVGSLEIGEDVKFTKAKKEFFKTTEDFQMLVNRVLKYISFVLVIDNFDDYFIDDKKEMFRFIIDFIDTVREVNMSLIKSSKNSKCIILVREDVLSKFASHDANIQKTLCDSKVTLNWQEQNGKRELYDMICNKILNSNVKLEGKSIRDIKELYFPTTKNKEQKSFIQIISEQGFGRPRDVTMYFKEIIDNNREEKKFSEAMIRENALQYSTYFMNELKNEMQIHFGSEYIDELFCLLLDLGRSKFSYKNISTHYIENKNKYPHINDLDKSLNDLYAFGALGYYVDGKKNRTHYYWIYRENAPEHIDLSRMICVHLGLKKKLNLK